LKKITIKSLFILLKEAWAVVQKTSIKNVTSTVWIFSFLSFDGCHGWKNHNQHIKNCTKTEKEETHAQQKTARSALSRERTLEL
jgi:hypothetical protein